MIKESVIITAIVCFTVIMLGLYFYHSKCSRILWDKDKMEITRNVDIESKTIELPHVSVPDIVRTAVAV